MKKRLLSVLLILCLSVSLLSGVTFAAYLIRGGLCGEVAYTLYSDGTLTIYGRGAMADYYVYSAVPWYMGGTSRVDKLVIEDGVTHIGSQAFSNSKYLTEITIPNSVTSIGYGTFSDSYRIKTITIPDSVTSIGANAFETCKALSEIEIPTSVTSIGSGAFANCMALTEITIPDSVTSIGSSTFYGCSSLTSVTIPDSVTSIGYMAFFNCYSLKEITIPHGVTVVEDNTFFQCQSLKEITIPSSVTRIEADAFYNCSGLSDVYYAGSATQWKKILIGSNNTSLVNATIHYGITEVSLSTINGAQVRTSGNQGLRFISSIDKTTADFSRVVEYGTVLIPTADITDISELQIGATLNGHEVAKVEAKNLYDMTDSKVSFTAVLTDIKEKNYAREYTARAYAILDDGSVVYADAGTSRSIYAVAKRGLENAAENEESKAVFQAIVDTVENA